MTDAYTIGDLRNDLEVAADEGWLIPIDDHAEVLEYELFVRYRSDAGLECTFSSSWDKEDPEGSTSDK